MARWWQDSRFALRMWGKVPAITIPVVLILALGIGANTAIFSIVDAIWLRPLPVQDPHNLLKITSHKAGVPEADRALSYPEVAEIRAGVRGFRSVAISSRRAVMLRTEHESGLLSAAIISSNYLSTLGVVPVLGKWPSGDELDTSGNSPEVALSYESWHKYFAGRPDIIGSSITLNRSKVIVAAVLPAEFRGTDPFANPAIWIPIGTWVQINPGERANETNREFWDWDAYSRLAPGTSMDQAQQQLEGISRQMAVAAPQQEQSRQFRVEPNDERSDPQLRVLGRTLMLLAMVVLIIAAVNVSILLLAFGQRRRRELATRVACGASRARLMWQLSTENGSLALISCIAALLIGYGLIRALPALLPSSMIPVGLDFRLDSRALFWTVLLSSLTVLVSGLLPALNATNFDLVGAIKEGTQAVSFGKLRSKSRNFMVVTQIAGSVVLLVATGLLFRSMLKLQAVDPGFDRNRKLLFVDLSLGVTDYDRVTVQKYYDRVVSTIDSVSAVEQTALARRVPLAPSGGRATKTVLFDNASSNASSNDMHGVQIAFTSVSPTYFSAMHTQLLRGRGFSTVDSPQSPKVAAINEYGARRFFPDGNALGQHFRIANRGNDTYEIVGIVQDGKYVELTESPQPFLFFALPQDPSADLTVIAVMKGDPSIFATQVRQEVRNVDPQVPVLQVRTMEEHLRLSTYTRRMTTTLVLALALLGLVLAMTGLYGLMSHIVDARSHEIGIRVALGGHPSDISWLVLRYALAVLAAGVAVGIVLSLIGGHTLSALLFGVSSTDAVTFLAVAIVFTIVGLIASAVPLRAALRVDPIRVLRHE